MANTIVPYQPSKNQVCSEPLYRFLSEYDEIVGLFFLTISMASHIDKVSAIARRALDGVSDTRKEDTEYLRDQPAFKKIRMYSPQVSRNLVLGMSNNFSVYLSEIIQTIMTKRHEVLRSNEQVATKEVLQFTRMRDVISYLADKKNQ